MYGSMCEIGDCRKEIWKAGMVEEEVCAARRIYYPFISNFYTQREGKVVRGGPFLFPPISHKKNEGGGNNVTGGHNGAKKVDG